MDEACNEDVAATSSTSRDDHILLDTESNNLLGSLDTSIHRSSTQEFMGLPEGKSTDDNLSSVHMSLHSYSSSAEAPKERMQDDSYHVNRPAAGPEAGSSMRHDVSNGGCVSPTKVLPESFSHNDNTVMNNTYSSGATRSRTVSKSAFDEYFVKGSLEGKGQVCSGEQLRASCAELRSQNEPGFCATLDSSCKSLREWLKTSGNKVNKVHGLSIFKKILDIVGSFHLKGNVLTDLRPSCFKLLPSKEVKYTGRISGLMADGISGVQTLKRPAIHSSYAACEKRGKLDENVIPVRKMQPFQFGYGLIPTRLKDFGAELSASVVSSHNSLNGLYSSVRFESCGNPSRSHLRNAALQLASVVDNGEAMWYLSPEERSGMVCTSSNIYSLGILLFELLSRFDSAKEHVSAMSDLGHRILPPKFLSENPKEARFCLWLLHPQPSLRPTICDVLQSEVVSGFQKMLEDDMKASITIDETMSEVLLHFLQSMKEQKETHASVSAEEIRCIETDIEEAEKRSSLRFPLMPSCSQWDTRERVLRQLSCVSQLESAYFSARSQLSLIEEAADIRPDVHVLSNRENSCTIPSEKESKGDVLGAFFDGFCKYARYSKLEVCRTLRNRELYNSANVICSLSFDRDGEYLAAAGVSKKVKLFEFDSLCNGDVDTHYPIAEMSNSSKLSCVSWNAYIRNYLASADYDGVVKIWDASTGVEVSEYVEHEKRAWSVDFSRLDPTKLASGSDDCTVRIWSINERNSLCSIRNMGNVCCVQYSPHSSHLLAFGSADYKIYCYDLRNADMPWCVLAGHGKSVSYVKFLDSETLVSASTDNTLKRWDLKRSSSIGLSENACNLTFTGHTNEKNFVGLSVQDGYIACGSETNEVCWICQRKKMKNNEIFVEEDYCFSSS